jgi:hypothetical protein
MKAGFKVETRRCDSWAKFLVVTNYHFANLVVNWPMINYGKENRVLEDVGMWRIKTLKK